MKPSSFVIAAALLAVGVCGILDAAAVVDSSLTIGQWWPLVVIAWPLAEMATTRRMTLGGVVCMAVGVTLLADTQGWASDAFVWSSLALFAGFAIIVDAALRSNQGPVGEGVHVNGNGSTS
jgi:hypothetical protein